jgi:hypothetical protein
MGVLGLVDIWQKAYVRWPVGHRAFVTGGWRRVFYATSFEGEFDMRIALIVLAVLCSAAFAQANPPMVGGKPPAQVKPHGEATTPHSIAAKLQACLNIDDGTKGRLDCYDAVIAPKPKPKPAVAKGVMDCRYIKEEDERLACFNGFAEMIPKFS